ncbi:DNA-3-methyladenine glycosylase [Lentibacillus salicampi]|uniref:DNA-3-methyladenine glycosylase n=1 Tax=Lentibacillus salicampi TaxID=175306 RepID=UPI001ADDC998|nr:DNA-3-methyladenine glycosylase [Lentibacillus salicampi]
MHPLPEPLDQSFYNQSTLQLAQSLLGKLLLKETDEGIVAGFIVETEAYMGPEDRAAHSFNNKRTKRTAIMFGEPGYAYTYVMHTHCLFNVVSGSVDDPKAVLIRGVEPYLGQSVMEKRRPKARKLSQLTNGPGKLTKALGITMDDYGNKLDHPPLWIAPGRTVEDEQMNSGPRIGIDNSGEARDYPWRFWVDGNAFISK